MNTEIKQAAVLGSGIMGRAIAALLAGAGIKSYLLDIVPTELTAAEKSKGLTLESPQVRNRLAAEAIKAAQKSKPATFFSPRDAALVTPGNLEDNLNWLEEVDWVVEVVVERLEIKRSLFQKVQQHIKPGTIVSSNTSGISINQMAQDLPLEFRQHFLGTHFFNPVRYMKLLEIIPGRDTLPEVVEFMSHFGEKVLGKGVVFCKDTPNFIANRIGTFGIIATARAMQEMGLTVEEVDALTGPVMGRPKSASFRTLDLVGLDTFLHVAANVRENASDPAEASRFEVPEFLNQMLAKGWLGDKTGQGFYKSVKTEKGKERLVLDYQTMDYRPQSKPSFDSLTQAKNAGGLKNSMKALVFAKDQGAAFSWRILKETLVYAAEKLGEIADDIVNIDRAMEWGFNWQQGPFKVWDLLGVENVTSRIRAEGGQVPAVVEKLLAGGKKSFYTRENGADFYYDPVGDGYLRVPVAPEVIILKAEKERQKLVKDNAGASLIDLGDGVACLEFHSPNNAIGSDIIAMIHQSLEEVEQNFKGLVIGNQGKNFCVGANLMLMLLEAQEENWDALEAIVKEFQDALMAVKYFRKPVVAAPFGMTLGGGCEISLHAHRIQAAAETYMGQVELGVGLIPGGGGNKEVLLRYIEGVPEGVSVDLQPMVNKAFELIAMSKVSTSAAEALDFNLLRRSDGISLNGDHLLYDAKNAVLGMAQAGFKPLSPAVIPVVGEDGLAMLLLMLETMQAGGYITPHDRTVAEKVAFVLSGGNLHGGTRVPEQYLLDLEREAFVSLLGHPKTQERMAHMLTTGKPLRN